MHKIKSNPTQLLMFGILAIFASLIIISVTIDVFSVQPTAEESTATATQTLVFGRQAGTLSTIVEMQMTATTTSVPSGTIAPPTGIILTPSARQTSTAPGLPSNVPPPPSLELPTEVQLPLTVPPPPTLFPASPGTYDDTSIAWQYSTGWTSYTGSGPHNDSIHSTNTVGSYVDFTFNGTGFTFIFTVSPTRGLIDVYIDTTKVSTIDAYDTITNWQSTWLSDTLTSGTHTVRFAHAGKGTYIDVDAISILP